jgi:hypothetical protein
LAEQSNSFNESEMALFYECMLKCAPKLLDTADIVREAMFRQLTDGAQGIVSRTERHASVDTGASAGLGCDGKCSVH